jgi:hypothetical protein
LSTYVFHHGALGDSVLTWPMLRALAPLKLVAHASHAHLAARWIADVEPLDIDRPHWSELFAPDAVGSTDETHPALGQLAGAHRIISFVSDGRDAWAANIRRFAPQAMGVFIRPRPDAGQSVHVVDHHRTQAAAQRIDYEPRQPEPRSNPAGPIVIHPGSGRRDKCWPADRFASLIDRLNRVGHAVNVLWGDAERERWSRVQKETWQQRFDIHQPMDVLSLAESIARASLFIGNDSGPTHLAAQLGVPTLALFGPTDPQTWAPRGRQVRILAPPSPRPMDWLSVEHVSEAALACYAGDGGNV